MNNLFRHFASRIAAQLGSPWAFLLALALVVVWALTGPVFGYSDAWQLVINTSTTIATFLMVFLLQNTQNRDTHAMNIKLDELLRAIDGARTGLVNVNELSDEELDRLERELCALGRLAGMKSLPREASVAEAGAARDSAPQPSGTARSETTPAPAATA